MITLFLKIQHFTEDNFSLIAGTTGSIIGSWLTWNNVEIAAKGYILLLTVLLTSYTAYKAIREIFGKKKSKKS